MDEKLLGKCGFYCGSCPTYLGGNCAGCVDAHEPGDCHTRDCVLGRGLAACGACGEFPCGTILTKERCTVLDKDWLRWKARERGAAGQDAPVVYRAMTEEDLPQAVSLYMDYYNDHEDGGWTEETARRRIRQVLDAPDSFCLVAEEGGSLAAFAIGHMEQYADLTAYDLVEIVVAARFQNQGLGTAFMRELERRVKEKGAATVQLEAVNSPLHAHFYGKLGYKNAENLLLKFKFL